MRALLFTVLLTGCAGEAMTEAPAEPARQSQGEQMAPDQKAPNGYNGDTNQAQGSVLEASLSSSQAWSREQGGKATLTITNPTGKPMSFTIASGMVADFVLSQGATEVWRYSSEMMFTQALGTLNLAAGESREVTVQVSARSLAALKPGQYRLMAYPNFHPRGNAPKVKPLAITLN